MTATNPVLSKPVCPPHNRSVGRNQDTSPSPQVEYPLSVTKSTCNPASAQIRAPADNFPPPSRPYIRHKTAQKRRLSAPLHLPRGQTSLFRYFVCTLPSRYRNLGYAPELSPRRSKNTRRSHSSDFAPTGNRGGQFHTIRPNIYPFQTPEPRRRLT